MPNIDVQVTFDAWKMDEDDPQSMTRRVIGAANTHLDGLLKNREINIRFATDEDVRALNLQFREKDTPTNVLSFPAVAFPAVALPGSGATLPEQENASLGDIILAYETVNREATEQEKSFSDHTTHLVLHGVLHLLGYDHDTDDRAKVMEDMERQVLAELSIRDPYAEVAHVS